MTTMRRAGTATERAGWVPQRGWGVPWMVMYWQLGGELMPLPFEKMLDPHTKRMKTRKVDERRA